MTNLNLIDSFFLLLHIVFTKDNIVDQNDNNIRKKLTNVKYVRERKGIFYVTSDLRR